MAVPIPVSVEGSRNRGCPTHRVIWVGGSDQGAPNAYRSHRLVVRTPASHVGNAGSTPAGITNKIKDFSTEVDFVS
jgi:hypothetical protein